MSEPAPQPPPVSRQLERLFPADERRRIADAVTAAEGVTSGEIVPYVVASCGGYEAALWRAAALGAALATALGALAFEQAWLWGVPGWLWVALPPLIGGVAGFALAALVPPLRRLLAGGATLDRRVAQRAYRAFVDEEVFATRERTGILLFIALFEHRVLVLGDSGINRRVAPEEWREVVDGIVAGIRGGHAADALVAAIERCGELLQRRGLERPEDDTDELADRLRLREE